MRISTRAISRVCTELDALAGRPIKAFFPLLVLVLAGLGRNLAAQSLGGTLYAGGNWGDIRNDSPVLAAGDLLQLSESSAQGLLQLQPQMELGPVNVSGDLWLQVLSEEHDSPDWEAQIQRLSAEYFPGSEWLLGLGIRMFHTGTAYVWNPSNPFTDPHVNNLDRALPYHRKGDPYAAAEWLGAADSLAIQAANWLPTDPLYGPDPGREHSLALRWGHVLESADVGGVLARREDENFVSLLGSMSLGERLELHAEGSIQDRRRTLLPVAQTIPVPGGSAIIYELAATDEDSTFGQFVVGGQYTFPNLTNVILEYFYNGAGYSPSEFRSLLDAVDAAAQGAEDPILGPANRGFLAEVAGMSGRMRRHYLFGRVAVPDLVGELNLHLFLRWGLDDEARVAGLLATLPLPRDLELRASAEHFSGPDDSEAELIPYRWLGSLALSLTF